MPRTGALQFIFLTPFLYLSLLFTPRFQLLPEVKLEVPVSGPWL